MGPVETVALKILENYPIYKTLPASISGKYHIGETQQQHVQNAVNVMKHLCDEFAINEHDRDLLIGATYLHDIGLYIITKKGKTDIIGWKYYEETDYSRHHALAALHPIIGAALLDNYNMPRKEEVKRLVAVHMSHWLPMCPQPETFYERLICIADYVASRGGAIIADPKRSAQTHKYK